jgi:hypothetical protein
MRASSSATVTVLVLCTLGCAAYESELSMNAAPSPQSVEVAASPAVAAEGGEMDRPAPAAGRGRDEARQSAAKPKGGDRFAQVLDGEEDKAEGEPSPEEPERTRQWFPEAFLWQPLVETGEDGAASVDFTVPDTLTTWRVLALAHDRSGHQAGAVHTFDGTLPVYVDPVVPGWLFAGDRLVLPVQAVNTTDRPLQASIEVRAEGAMSGVGRASMALGPGGSDVRTLPLEASASGQAKITATLSAVGGADAAERSFPVIPAGRPVVRTRGGTLADRRAFTLAGPEGADPRTEEIEIVVFPGPLAVVQAELERVRGGARPEDGAYGFALAARAAGLSAVAGVEVDEAALRRLRILGWQRLVREARAPDPGLAADLLLSLDGTAGHEQVEGLRPRLVRALVDGQRADGTWARRASSTLQEVLVQTAVAGKALPEGEQGARLRAAAAVERHGHEVKDAFTAAVVLASGLADEGRAEVLRKLVAEAITEDDAGEPSIAVPSGVVDAWGVTPTRAELLAWVVLALPADAPHRADLASQLMQGWDARYGFGAGRADAVALGAIASALPGATDRVDLTLSVGGTIVASAALDPTQPKVPVVLSAPAGTGRIELAASPKVPGLAFVATRRSFVPWSAEDRVRGVEVEVEARRLRVGEAGVLRITASAPSRAWLVLDQGLPSGAAIDEEQARAAASAV